MQGSRPGSGVSSGDRTRPPLPRHRSQRETSQGLGERIKPSPRTGVRGVLEAAPTPSTCETPAAVGAVGLGGAPVGRCPRGVAHRSYGRRERAGGPSRRRGWGRGAGPATRGVSGLGSGLRPAPAASGWTGGAPAARARARHRTRGGPRARPLGAPARRAPSDGVGRPPTVTKHDPLNSVRSSPKLSREGGVGGWSS